MLEKTKKLIKRWYKQLKHITVNRWIENSNTRFLGRCFMNEFEDHYEFFKIVAIKDDSDKATCLIIFTPKDLTDNSIITDTGKYRFATNQDDVLPPYTNIAVQFLDFPLNALLSYHDITNKEFNDTVIDIMTVLSSLNVCEL